MSIEITQEQYNNAHLGKKPWYYEKDINYVDIQNIILTEPVHLNAKGICFGRGIGEIYDNSRIISPVAIRLLPDGRYSLVIGLVGFIKAKLANLNKIAAIITDLSRSDFIKSCGLSMTCEKIHRNKTQSNQEYEFIDIKDITIPRRFLETNPDLEKVNKIKDVYFKHNELDKPVSIRKKYILCDGYIRYLIAKELGLKHVLVKFNTD